uniref:Alpha-1A adrenergic receptor n=1 Tax=Denticeps clupeoides TaxID=299321 RepID=A0AAY4AU77_9TELE
AVPASDHTPNCSNCSVPVSPGVDPSKVVLLGLVLVVFVVFGVLGNVLVILSVVCHRHLHSVTHYLVANLAAADLLLSLAVVPFSAASEALGRWVFGRTLCSTWATLDVLCCTASILSLCVISVDRYLAVRYPLRYPYLATRRRGVSAVVAIWVLSAAICVGPLFGWREPMPEDEAICGVNEDPSYALFSALGSFYVPLAVILAMYCQVYVVARRETRSLIQGQKRDGLDAEAVTLRIHRGNTRSSSTEEQDGRRGHFTLRLLKFSREKKAAKTLGMVVGCFVLCWLPFFLVLPIGSIFPSYRPSEAVFKVTFWLGYFNSCLNPIIYPCFSQEFKKAFQNVLRCQCLRRTTRPSKFPGGPNPGPLPLLTPHPPVSSSSSTSLQYPSVPVPPSHSHAAEHRSKNLLKVCCFRANPRPHTCTSLVQGKTLRLSLGTKAGQAV